MPLLSFVLQAAIISLSGVMAPGPISAVAVGKGSKSPYAGALVAIGHGMIELPLMVAILYGLGSVLSSFYVYAAIAFVGGLFLFIMGVGMLRNVKQVEVGSSTSRHSPVIDGVLLTVGNPYFLIWWATVGATLILHSAGFGLLGFLCFALLHWLCDLMWSSFLSVLSF
jgi:threonine/homoserine/homoserine lactone efflux protein